jgi:hypothetical protein
MNDFGDTPGIRDLRDPASPHYRDPSRHGTPPDFTTSLWICSPRLRWIQSADDRRLQQLWSETYSGRTEWRDVPVEAE